MNPLQAYMNETGLSAGDIAAQLECRESTVQRILTRYEVSAIVRERAAQRGIPLPKPPVKWVPTNPLRQWMRDNDVQDTELAAKLGTSRTGIRALLEGTCSNKHLRWKAMVAGIPLPEKIRLTAQDTRCDGCRKQLLKHRTFVVDGRVFLCHTCHTAIFREGNQALGEQLGVF